MVTAIRWMPMFVGRAESTLLFSPGLFPPDNRYISLQMEDFNRKASVLVTQKSLQERVSPFPF